MAAEKAAVAAVGGVPRPWRTSDVADFLSCSTETVRDLARSGRLRGRKMTKSWMFDPRDVQRFAGVEPEGS